MKDRNYSEKELLAMPPMDLLNYLTDNYVVKIPLVLDSPESYAEASKELSKASAYYTYLQPLKTKANILKRELKRDKENKEAFEDMLSREQILEMQINVMKQSYDTISRLFTIKSQEIQELRMLGLLT